MKYGTLPLYNALDAVAGLELKGTVDTAKEQNQRALGDEPLSDYEQRYTAIRQAGVEEEGGEEPPASGSCGPRKPSKSQNRLDRLGETGKRHWPLKDVAVPFDTHLAERDLWMMRVKQKGLGCFHPPLECTPSAASEVTTLDHEKARSEGGCAALKDVFLGAPLAPAVPG